MDPKLFDAKVLEHLPIVMALLAGPLAMLMLAWRGYVWLQRLIRAEIRPLAKRITRVEKVLGRVIGVPPLPEITDEYPLEE